MNYIFNIITPVTCRIDWVLETMFKFMLSQVNQAAVSWKFGHCYFWRDLLDALCGNYYFGENSFFNQENTVGKQLF